MYGMDLVAKFPDHCLLLTLPLIICIAIFKLATTLHPSASSDWHINVAGFFRKCLRASMLWAFIGLLCVKQSSLSLGEWLWIDSKTLPCL